MPAKDQTRIGRCHAPIGFLRRRDIGPAPRRAGIAMDIKPFTVPECEWKLCEKVALGCAEPPPRPLDDGLRLGIHAFTRIAYGVVMIALQRNRALADKRHDGIDGPFGIAAIADIVAQKHEARRSQIARLREAGG